MPTRWHIYHVKNCSHTKPVPKDKFVAIVCGESNLMRGFLVNTKIHSYIQKRPSLLACQVRIKASTFPFLDHDSYINCVNLFPFEGTELVDARQEIDNQTKKEIKRAVANSRTIEPIYMKLILGK